MKTQQCMVCGFAYDPHKGDHLSNIGPETSFEELPEDWRCPICRSGKSSFEPAESAGEPEGSKGGAGKG